jgi:glycogen operon protein
MQVDGFRFDLASAISRTGDRFNQNHPLLVAIYQDPILTEVKLISEPWDATAEGYQLGGFPPEWQEWNDKYRDSVRRFWRGDGRTLGSFASSLAGSSDTFVGHHSRSINFVTAHDGFTLRDLVSYEEKHNEANAQNGQDGTNANYSSNYGDEGETEDKKIKKLRVQLQKNFLATLLLSKGVPMLLGGDELNRTQLGNNNAYCHDVDWNYLNWKTSTNFSDWVTELVKLRNKVSHITSSKFYLDSEVEWLTEANVPLTAFDWHSENSEPLVLKIKQALDGKDLILAFNPTDQPIRLDFPEMNLIISSAKILNKDPAILPEKSFAAFSKDE